MVKLILSDYNGQEGVIILILLPFSLYMIRVLNKRRQISLLKKYHNGQIKMEIEYEVLLAYLVEMAQDSHWSSSFTDRKFAIIAELFETHQLSCQDVDCICLKKEDFFQFFKQAHTQNSNIFLVEASKYKRIKNFITGKANALLQQSLNLLKQEAFYQQKLKKKQNLDDENEGQIMIDKNEGNLPFEAAGQPEKLIKIDINEVKDTFITNFILIYFNEVKKKYPASLKIQTICNHYSMFIAKRPQLCISQLRHYSDKGLSFLDRITKYVNEQYILYHYDIQQQKHDQKDLSSKVDGEHFIKINDLYGEFHGVVDQLSMNSQEFWKGFTFEEVDVHRQHEFGEKIADLQEKCYKIFKQIEETLIQKDYKIYIWFANIQLMIMNDQEGYQMFMQKMRSIIQMSKIFANTNAAKYGDIMSEDAGFVVTDAHASKSGKLLFMNKNLKRWLRRENDDLKFFNINYIMPQLIGDRHDEFMTKYNQTGESFILGKRIVNFLLDKNGSLFPVEVLVKFHYSQKFQYCFITFVSMLKELTPFHDQLKYESDQLVFITIDLEDGKIFEVSKSFVNLLKASGISHYKTILQLDLNERRRTLSDVLVDFQINKLDKYRYQKDRATTTDYYEEIHKFDNSTFLEGIDAFHQKELYVKASIHIEAYSNGKLEVGFVTLSLINQNFTFDCKGDDSDIDIFEEQNMILAEQQQLENDSLGSSSNASSQSGSSMSSFHAIQQFHTFYKQTTPRILKIAIQLIILMFLVSVTVASVNLSLNVNNHYVSQTLLQQIHAAVARLSDASNIRMMIRVLLNIGNGYEPNNSKLLNDRFSTYKSYLQAKIDDMKAQNDYLLNNAVFVDPTQAQKRNSMPIQIEYLTGNNQIRFENVNFLNLQTLYITGLTEASAYNRSQFSGNDDIQSLNPNLSKNYNPTVEEQNFAFLIYNGNGPIVYYNRYFANSYVNDTLLSANINDQQTLISTIISIVTIFIVTCIIAPIISKTEERKYNALQFFLKIPKIRIAQFIQNCQRCQNLDLNRSPGLKKRKHNIPANQVLSDTDQPDHSLVINDDGNDYTEMNSKDNSLLDISSKRLLFGSKNNRPRGNSIEMSVTSVIADQQKQQTNEEESQNLQGLMKVVKRGKKNKPSMQEIMGSSDSQSQVQDHDQSQNQQQENLQAKKEKKEKKQEEDSLELNLNTIRKIGFRNKLMTIAVVLGFMLVFSVYFVASYIMATNNYDAYWDASNTLNTIFSVQNYLDNMIIFLRENVIENKTVTIYQEPDNIATNYYLNLCLEQEVLYQQIRQQNPAYLYQAMDLMNIMETSQFCTYTLADSEQDACKIALNGLMSKGVSNAIAYMINLCYKFNLEFMDAYENNALDLAFLVGQLSDPTMIEMIDTKLYVMPDSFTKLQQECMSSTSNYFAQLLNDFVILYCVFIAILIVSMIYASVFAFKRLRRSMWNTNMLLKIIPPQTLSKKDEEKLKQFFVN